MKSAKALHAAKCVEEAARQSLTIAYAAVLQAEQIYQQALVNVARARTRRLADSMALLQVLVAGWWSGRYPMRGTMDKGARGFRPPALLDSACAGARWGNRTFCEKSGGDRPEFGL
ncbi:hypothetical protein [Ralstonia pickettii]|uniref:hypothetical protein n=1 Tax=Ralstonia pickettii TaxID=329 RepID=UPI0004693652|nr:hypothetical protein [Ralstonia pickettii]